MNHTKENILLSALRLFAQDGYEAVSVSKIAGALGMTKSALYRHYRNKRAIFDSILSRMEESDAEQASAYALPEDTVEKMANRYRDTKEEQLIAFSKAQFRYWTANPFASLFRKMLTLEQYRNDEMKKLYRQYLTDGPLGYVTDLLQSRHVNDAAEKAVELYAPMFLFYSLYDRGGEENDVTARLDAYLDRFEKNLLMKNEENTMLYPHSQAYNTPELLSKIMGPNPIKLEEELMNGNRIPAGATVCDLGSGQGLTSLFLAKEYGFTVYAADLWSDPEENRTFFRDMGISDSQIIPVKADATALPFAPSFFDAVISTDSYNYFGRDPRYLDEKLLPFVKKGGYLYLAVPGMKKDLHKNLPASLLLSWTPEQLDYLHDVAYWTETLSHCEGAEVLSVHEMESNDEVWADWLKQENDYAIGDRKSMEAGAGQYLNFIAMILRKK